jgi:toxin ParE1/3/4
MDYQIIWSPKAVENLDAICAFIAEDSPYYASLTANKILKLIDNLSVFPESGRIVPEYYNHNIREIIYKSYRIVYRIKEDIIEIAAICHSSRKELDL